MSDLKSKLDAVEDPFLGLTLGELDAVAVEGDAATVTLPSAVYPPWRELQETCDAAAGGAAVTLKNKPRSGGPAMIAVGSGKGGVGKSTVAAGLALALADHGAAVGLLDADVYGPSIPHMLNAHGKLATIQAPGPGGQVMEQIVPAAAGGVKIMSMAYLVPETQAVVFRGPMVHKYVTIFLQQVAWGDLDYLIVDMPPGTGDVALTMSQQASLAGAVVVCTPQKVALLDAVKACSMYGQVNIPLLGMVENMSGEMFGRGGTRAKAEELEVPFLGEVPAAAAIRELCDDGKAAELLGGGSPAREPLREIALNVAKRAALAEMSKVELPSLEE